MKTFDPNWPFPQYDNEGKRLLPANWNKPEPKQALYYPLDAQDALI